MSAEQLMGLSLSSCPDSGMEESDGASQRRFSRLSSERSLAGRPLLAWVQKQQQPIAASSLATDAEANGPCVPCIKEQGTVFKQNMAVMKDMLHKEVLPFLRCAAPSGATVGIAKGGPLASGSAVLIFYSPKIGRTFC